MLTGKRTGNYLNKKRGQNAGGRGLNKIGKTG